MPYQVLDWNDHFENSKSRTYDHCSYVCMPNKQGGMGLTRILSEPDGATIIGIWVLILQVLSQQKKPREGWLTDDGQQAGRAWTVSDLAMRWRRTDVEIARALEVLSASNVGWLKQLEVTVPEVSAQYPSSIPEVSANGARSAVSNEQNNNELNSKEKKEPRGKKRRTYRVDELPDAPFWLNAESWQQWVEYRDEKGNPVTPSMARAQYRKLDKLRARGQPPEDVLEESMANGWVGIFALDSNGNGRAPTGAAANVAIAKQAVARMREREQHESK